MEWLNITVSWKPLLECRRCLQKNSIVLSPLIQTVQIQKEVLLTKRIVSTFLKMWNYHPWRSNTLAIWCKKPTHRKRPWRWERLKAGKEGDSRGWDSQMTSQIQWTWVWENSGSWRTGKPGMLLSMGSQRVEHNWATKQQQQQSKNNSTTSFKGVW